ncbi:oligopeptide ABC transporter ATP-binding protein, partial [Candidatus Bathyarchaeota archaeon]
AFLYITHDVSTAKYLAQEAAVMYAGKIVEMGPFKKILSEPLHPYTKALLEAIPDPDPKNRFVLRKTVPGEPPNLINPPPGCRFNPRCPMAMDICKREEPKLREIGGRLVACHNV